MGVTGLLRLVQPYTETKPVTSYAGKTLGVDAYSWLHRAAICCAEELVRGEYPTRLLQSIDNRVRVYEQHNIQLYFVFDGAPLKMKERIALQRKRVREAARADAERSTSSMSTASYMKRAIDIKSDHAAMVIAYLRARGIKYVVAPYEADAQLVFLEQNNIIDGIISEDSDMLIFGAQKLLTKADARSGQCVEVNSAALPPQFRCLRGLRAIAIISGCDYSPGVAGLGPVKAAKLVEVNNGDLESIIRYVTRNNKVDGDFEEIARNANAAFIFQRVWDPRRCVMTYLNAQDAALPPLTAGYTMSTTSERTTLDFSGSAVPASASLSMPPLDIPYGDSVIGANIPRPVAHRLALGQIDPRDFNRVLSVQPHISAFVAKMTPFRPPKPHKLSTPLAVSKEVNRRLNITPVGSISQYFKQTKHSPENLTGKENTFPTPQTGKRSAEMISAERAKISKTASTAVRTTTSAQTISAQTTDGDQSITNTAAHMNITRSTNAISTPTRPQIKSAAVRPRTAFGPVLTPIKTELSRRAFGPVLISEKRGDSELPKCELPRSIGEKESQQLVDLVSNPVNVSATTEVSTPMEASKSIEKSSRTAEGLFSRFAFKG